ncbi:hypothetical protein [Rhizobium sp. Root482]|jgi:hypothetical protein|uniref:Pam3-gp28 family putative phage holin n=1 Tax=Rhizobium sp. Root482 TaxID=1736543 RepID=UPI0006F2C3F6|nr:hypothetical protein [Rhizobium sp. Root482]KQY22553.1 hypothetical protein ASD31_22970 [Rhizobium sp. Root482]
MNITNYLPVILRYAIVWAAAALATRGFISDDQSAVLSQNIDVIAGALISPGTVVCAVQAAFCQSARCGQSDRQIRAAKADVTIETPGNAPDNVVPAK